MIEETGEAIDGRARLVAWARGEVGEQDPDKYYRTCAPEFVGHKHDKSWCGIFCLAGLVELGFCDWKWQNGRGFVWRLRPTSDPLPGDIAVFRKGADGRDIWHHAIVADARAGEVSTFDGNVLPFPREGVAFRIRPIDANVTFYSIAELLREHRARQDTMPDLEASDTDPSPPPESQS